MIVFSEIQRCQLPHSTQVFQKAKTELGQVDRLRVYHLLRAEDPCLHHAAEVRSFFPSPFSGGGSSYGYQRHLGGGQSGGAAFLAGFGAGFFPAPLKFIKIHGNLQI